MSNPWHGYEADLIAEQKRQARLKYRQKCKAQQKREAEESRLLDFEAFQCKERRKQRRKNELKHAVDYAYCRAMHASFLKTPENLQLFDGPYVYKGEYEDENNSSTEDFHCYPDRELPLRFLHSFPFDFPLLKLAMTDNGAED